MRITNVPTTCGEGVDSFAELFRSRYQKLSKLFRGVMRPSPIRSLGERAEAVGLVSSEPKRTRRGHTVFDLEDPSGTVSVWSFDGNGRGCPEASQVLPDEVVGVVGRKWNGGIVAEKILWPEVSGFRPGRGRGRVAVTADIHIGSKEFMKGAWNRFISWLRTNPVDLVIVAGDLVAGVGVYPGQQKDLVIPDIRRQYEAARELLEEIPESTEIVVVPGNHDLVRPLEPQPPIPVELGRAKRGTNPCYIEFNGVKILVYHGKSFDDLAKRGFSFNRPVEMAVRLLRSRHLAPVWGGETPLAPTSEDHMVIEETPDLFVVAHSHVFGYGSYRGVTVVSAGPFQGPTDYTERTGIKPTPGTVGLIDLETFEVKKLCFA
jgi:DNA polymerase II small subunit